MHHLRQACEKCLVTELHLICGAGSLVRLTEAYSGHTMLLPGCGAVLTELYQCRETAATSSSLGL